MTLGNIFDAEGDGSEDDGTLYSLSGEFLEAARVLQAASQTRVNFSMATYYLLGHSTELLFKAFLFKHGVSINALTNIGHDLKKLAHLAKERGLPENLHFQSILQLASTYKGKSFEYRKWKKEILPNLDLLTEEIKSLQSVVFDYICK
jgi:hypothetical protein